MGVEYWESMISLGLLQWLVVKRGAPSETEVTLDH